MHLVLLGFIGLWLLLWATFLGSTLINRIEGERHSLTLLGDSHIELSRPHVEHFHEIHSVRPLPFILGRCLFR